MLVEAKDIGDGVRILTLNRPPANAISREFNEALYDRCREASENPAVRAVIVTGINKFFSGGLDIKEQASGKSRVGVLGSEQRDGVFALWTLPKPTVAMVNGHAIAGGLIIMLACDFRIAARGTARFGANEVAIGLPLPIVPVEIARLALGTERLRHCLLEAETCDAERAFELGYFDELVAPEELEARCVAQARKLAKLGQLAYAEVKRLIQFQALERVRNVAQDEMKAWARVASAPESVALLEAQVRSISKK
ncbi:MAG TPA: enoyl-CoA hydratase/isomerase family protein [Candidatus Binataceae bacterium]|nr:enoyl-CoA hydratase/isomerase family protein [Candidatus Binataceae bacterium]